MVSPLPATPGRQALDDLRFELKRGDVWEQHLASRIEDGLDAQTEAWHAYLRERQWQTGRPPDHGYYLAAWRRQGQLVVSELWFNPDSTGSGWWAGRAYLGDRPWGGGDPLPVVAWMPMPAPPAMPEAAEGTAVGYRVPGEVADGELEARFGCHDGDD
jgi:hypothetical protein